MLMWLEHGERITFKKPSVFNYLQFFTYNNKKRRNSVELLGDWCDWRNDSWFRRKKNKIILSNDLITVGEGFKDNSSGRGFFVFFFLLCCAVKAYNVENAHLPLSTLSCNQTADSFIICQSSLSLFRPFRKQNRLIYVIYYNRPTLMWLTLESIFKTTIYQSNGRSWRCLPLEMKNFIGKFS